MAYTVEGLLTMLPGAYEAAKIKGVNTSVQMNITGSQAGNWYVVSKDDKLTVTKGILPNPEITVGADTEDILAVAEGKLDPMKAFMLGKLKVKGDMTEVMKLVQLFTKK
jgi:putative sterol carrier protein